MPSVRRSAKNFSQREGVSLNQFINTAVAERLAHLQHDEWLARRPKATGASIAKALDLLDRPGDHAAKAFDTIPDGYARDHSKTVLYKLAGKSPAGRRKV